MTLRPIDWLAGWGGLLLLAGSAVGQDRDRSIDPRDIIRSADDNGDGIIEPSELGQRSGYYVRQAAQRIGLDPNGNLPVDKILPALEAMKNEQRGGQSGGSSSSGSGGSSSGSGGSSQPAPMPTGPQPFGEAASGPAKVPGFDVPLSVNVNGSLEKQFDPRVIEYVNDMLRERDVNKNGILEKAEWTGRWSTPPEESDLNKDGVLSRDELCVRIAKRFGIGAPGSSASTSSSGSSGSQSGASSGGSSGSGDSSRLRGYAESLIKQYDDSKNGMLERDEWKEMRSEHQSSDANKDGVITIDELAAHLQAYSGGGSSSGGNSFANAGPSAGPGGPPGPGQPSFSSRFGDRISWGSRGPSSGDKSKEPLKKSYRFLSPTERLPKGMPDWFLRGDADGDGQISMVEYAASWTEQVAAEFQKYDLDSDGLVTPEECQKVESSKLPKK